MLLKPQRVDLDHRAYFLRGSLDNDYLIVADDHRHVTILNAQLDVAHSFSFPGIKGIAPDPSGRLLAIASGQSGSVIVHRIDGTPVVELDSPEVEEDCPIWLSPGFEDCFFDNEGEYLWLIAPRNMEEYEVQLIEIDRWSVTARISIENPISESTCSFHRTPESNMVALWIAAGQDGQQLFWLTKSQSGIDWTAGPSNTIPPAFVPNGETFLVIDENNVICKFEYPSMKQVGSFLASDFENDDFSCSLCFLDDRYAFAGMGSGRIFMVDTSTMTLGEEMIIEGHEPRPTREYYPGLDDSTLCTDIDWFTRSGRRVFFISRRDDARGPGGWKDSILGWEPPEGA